MLTLSSVPCRTGHNVGWFRKSGFPSLWHNQGLFQAASYTCAKLHHSIVNIYLSHRALLPIGHPSANTHAHVAGLIEEPVEGLLFPRAPHLFILPLCVFLLSNLIALKQFSEAFSQPTGVISSYGRPSPLSTPYINQLGSVDLSHCKPV